jgi:hypothetical protein
MKRFVSFARVQLSFGLGCRAERFSEPEFIRGFMNAMAPLLPA